MADKFGKNSDKETIIKPSEGKGGIFVDRKHEERIKETSKETGEGLAEVVEGVESAEFTEGNVSERGGEGKQKASAGGIKQGGAGSVSGKTAIAEPAIDIMRIQISTQIKNEIRLLEREAAKLISAPHFSPFKLNGIVAKIRELKEILSNLAYATTSSIKGWWIKYVRGETI